MANNSTQIGGLIILSRTVDTRCLSASLVYSLNHISSVDKGIIQITADFVFFDEYLVQGYLRQLLSAVSCLHEKRNYSL
ncbi:unnamed protein product [Rotaria sp. Silwood1]|nr:unnamed protein product [Rotaria sp. Silwood1]